MTLKIRPLPQTVQQGNFLQELDKMKRLDIIEITLRERLTVPIHLMKIGKDYIDLLTGSRYTVSSKQGTFEECLKVNNEFATMIPELFGLTVPEGSKPEDAIGEGFVIRPVDGERFLNNGSRVIIKSKNSKFSERKPSGNAVKNVTLTDSATELLNSFLDYINENRVAAVQSKIGEANWKEIGKVAGLTLQDALLEFNEYHEYEVRNVVEDQWSLFSKLAMQECMQVVREYYKKVI